jgi:hypothetical protein
MYVRSFEALEFGNVCGVRRLLWRNGGALTEKDAVKIAVPFLKKLDILNMAHDLENFTSSSSEEELWGIGVDWTSQSRGRLDIRKS